MSSILLSGFAPFGGCSHNPSQDIVESLHGYNIEGVSVVGCVLPVVRNLSWDILKAHMDKHQPMAVMALGQSQRVGIQLERMAYNQDYYRIADNAGNQPQNEKVIASAPESLPSTLPLMNIFAALQTAGLAVDFSDDAGRFVCNHLFFQMQYALQDHGIASGFVHVPFVYAPWVETGIVKAIHCLI